MTASIRHLQTFVAIVSLALTAAISASADQLPGTAEEAKDMVARAIAYYDEHSAEKAFEKFTDNPSPEFFERDLYIFVIAMDSESIVAHAVNSSLIGSDIKLYIDNDGREFGKKMLKTATENGTWIKYKSKMLDGKVRSKSSWMVLHDGHLFGVGVYKY